MNYRDTDLAYIAGLFDGEGTLTIGKLKPHPSVYGGCINPSYMLRFAVSQTLPEVLRWCRDMVGLGNVSEGYHANGHYMSKWQAGGKTAYHIIKLIQPHVRIKRPQVELGIFFFETSKWSFGGHNQTKPEETARRAVICDAIRCLNHSLGRIDKLGELLGHPDFQDNQQPSQLNVVDIVSWKVQRLMGEDTTTNNPDTSAQPEREDIVRTCG